MSFAGSCIEIQQGLPTRETRSSESKSCWRGPLLRKKVIRRRIVRISHPVLITILLAYNKPENVSSFIDIGSTCTLKLDSLTISSQSNHKAPRRGGGIVGQVFWGIGVDETTHRLQSSSLLWFIFRINPIMVTPQKRTTLEPMGMTIYSEHGLPALAVSPKNQPNDRIPTPKGPSTHYLSTLGSLWVPKSKKRTTWTLRVQPHSTKRSCTNPNTKHKTTKHALQQPL